MAAIQIRKDRHRVPGFESIGPVSINQVGGQFMPHDPGILKKWLCTPECVEIRSAYAYPFDSDNGLSFLKNRGIALLVIQRARHGTYKGSHKYKIDF
jgi:hypothetical protein